jgi:hypothetical protein
MYSGSLDYRELGKIKIHFLIFFLFLFRKHLQLQNLHFFLFDSYIEIL